MNKASQILRDIKLAELLGSELKGDAKKIKDFIDDTLDGLIQFEVEKYPKFICYKKIYPGEPREKLFFNIDFSRPGEVYLWCNMDLVWNFFYEDMKISDDKEIAKIISHTIGTYLNYPDLKPGMSFASDVFLKEKQINCISINKKLNKNDKIY